MCHWITKVLTTCNLIFSLSVICFHSDRDPTVTNMFLPCLNSRKFAGSNQKKNRVTYQAAFGIKRGQIFLEEGEDSSLKDLNFSRRHVRTDAF